MIKIAFFDIDGTLLKYKQKELSEKTIKALHGLQKNGVLLCMATGRGLPLIPHFKDVTFDILLTFNGSYVAYGDKVIVDQPLLTADKEQILHNLQAMHRATAICNKELLVTNGTDDDLEEYYSFGGSEIIIADNFDELCKGDIYQIMCGCRAYEYEQILAGTKHIQITSWWEKAADIIPAHGGKGHAVTEVLSYFGFAKEEAIAFGDGENDIEMLEAVGTGVAMGNAKDKVKERADVVCKSVDEDGVYVYCLENGLINA